LADFGLAFGALTNPHRGQEGIVQRRKPKRFWAIDQPPEASTWDTFIITEEEGRR